MLFLWLPFGVFGSALAARGVTLGFFFGSLWDTLARLWGALGCHYDLSWIFVGIGHSTGISEQLDPERHACAQNHSARNPSPDLPHLVDPPEVAQAPLLPASLHSVTRGVG